MVKCVKNSCNERSYANSYKLIEDSRLEDENDDFTKKQSSWFRTICIGGLLIVWFFSTVILMSKREQDLNRIHQISVPAGQIRNFIILHRPKMSQIQVQVGGALLPKYYDKLSTHYLEIWFDLLQLDTYKISNVSNTNIVYTQKISDKWSIPIVSEKLIDVVPQVDLHHTFDIHDTDPDIIDSSILQLRMFTDLESSFPIALSYNLNPIDPEDGIIYAAIVLISLYFLIIFEIIHRTIAAVLAAIASIAILAVLNERPTKGVLSSFVDIETLLLLFSMMVLVGIFSETGIFDYLAVLAYKITNGKVWPLINTLCLFTAAISSFLDNVTTVLLMTPVTIRLCEVTELNPVPVLTAMVIYSNIGGAFTLVGDPPNVILGMNPDVIQSGVTFGTFTLHMGTGLLLIMFTVHLQLRYLFRNINVLRFAEPQDVQELRHEIAIWQRAAASLSSYSKDESIVRDTLLKKCRKLGGDLKRKLIYGSVAMEHYRSTLEELQEKYPIRDKCLLIKSGAALMFVIIFFFLHSIPELNLSLGWTALLGVVLLLLLADRADLEGVLARIEWSTLLFFTALFILIGALSKLGLIEWIGQQTEAVILSVDDKESRLAVAIVLILWVSAIVSSFVDNIPLATMMIRVITSLAQNEKLNLPLQPLVWALAFGGCLGGNGTLIAASSNLVCAGVAEQHGYRFSFTQYFKIGYPIMIGSVIVATGYLLCVHVLLRWNC